MLEQMSQTLRERLAYIEFRLYFLGEVNRSDLTKRFGVGLAVATRDFTQYKEIAADNIEFDNISKTYVISKDFKPFFEHDSKRVMSALSQGFGEGINSTPGSLIDFEAPMMLGRLKLHILAPITRAINLKKPVKIHYFSGASGASERVIVPFAMASDGLRWHVRAFDRKSNEFRDFVIARMDFSEIDNDSAVKDYESEDNDIQWNRIVELDLVPHPNCKYPDLVKRDFEMHSGVLHVKLRAAMAGYVMRQYHVDCSQNHTIEDLAFRLWLVDPLALYGVTSAIFAPGYSAPKFANK